MLLLASGCGVDLNTGDTSGTGGSDGTIEDENSALCAPFESMETGGAEVFPPPEETATLFACEGLIDVDISGLVCVTTSVMSTNCVGDLEIIPTDEEPVLNDVAIGVPSPIINSTVENYPAMEIGACCTASVDEDALTTVCKADCGARACIAAAAELAEIIADTDCHFETLEIENCHLELPVVEGIQSSILGRTVNDLTDILTQLQDPMVFEQCQNSIRSDEGWRPCLPRDCKGATDGQGRLRDLVLKADCDGIDPVLVDDPGAPDEPIECDMNLNANVGAALPGEDRGGPLAGGQLAFETPLGDVTTTIVGSTIGFRRMPCEGDVCMFTLTDLSLETLDFEIGRVTVLDLSAVLAHPVAGILRGDDTATIDARSMILDVTFGVRINNRALFGEQPIPIRVSNDQTVTLTITDDDIIEITNASFAFPSNVRVGLMTGPAAGSPQP